MGIRKFCKPIIALIIIIEIIFLCRTLILYSFYKDDETYGDGVANSSKFDNEFLSTITVSLFISFFLILIVWFVSKKI